MTMECVHNSLQANGFCNERLIHEGLIFHALVYGMKLTKRDFKRRLKHFSDKINQRQLVLFEIPSD